MGATLAMKEIGELLRKKREEKGISLLEAQAATKIRTKYLQALEEGDDSVIPAEVYARGFLRSYAGFLGLDEKEILERYSEWKSTQRPNAEEEEPPRPQLVPTFKPLPRRRSYTGVWLLVAVIVLGAAVWGLIEYGRSVGDSGTRIPAEPAVEEPQESEPVETEETGAKEPAGPPPPVYEVMAEGDREVVVLVHGERIEVAATASEVCWVAVRSDDRTIFEGNLQPGVRVSWEARDSLWIRMGRPAVVAFEVNGAAFGPVSGSEGPPKNVLFKRENKGP